MELLRIRVWSKLKRKCVPGGPAVSGRDSRDTFRQLSIGMVIVGDRKG